MKFYDNDDDLDRALFALELEEPPAGLRASILAATIYHQAPARAADPIGAWIAGGLLALLAWLLIMAAQGHAAPYVSSAQPVLDRVLGAFANLQNLLWTAIGGAIAVWLSQLNLTLSPGALQTRRR